MDEYDVGLLNDWGGGNVAWWHDYLRYEIGRANAHWIQQTESLRAELAGMTADLNRLRDALTTIKDLPDLSGFGASHETIFQMRIIARDALREEGDK